MLKRLDDTIEQRLNLIITQRLRRILPVQAQGNALVPFSNVLSLIDIKHLKPGKRVTGGPTYHVFNV